MEESPFHLRLINEALVEKLKMLQYEKKYVKALKARPVERHTFAVASSSGDQFFSFLLLSSWLIRECGQPSYVLPQQLDDPNTSIADIITFVRSKDGGSDWAVNRLKRGTGEDVLKLLTTLADYALQHNELSMHRAEWREEREAESGDEGEGSSGEESAEEVEELWDEDEGVLLDLSAPSLNTGEMEGVMRSEVKDVEGWREEVHRVTPLLTISIRDAKDWRVHIDSMMTMKGKMEQLQAATLHHLQEVGSSVDKAVVVMEEREKSLSAHLSAPLAALREKKDVLAERAAAYTAVSGGIAQRSATLHTIGDDISQMKEHMDMEGTRHSDAAPVVRVRQSVSKLFEESVRVGVQCSVAEHSIIHAQLFHRLSFTHPSHISL